MTAIAFAIPVEIERITAGLERFLRAEVIARHEKHLERLEDPRRRYGSDGRYTPEAVELIRQVRMASVAAYPRRPGLRPAVHVLPDLGTRRCRGKSLSLGRP